jgi:DNA-binding transcriptional LysR family regulator
MPVNLSLAQRKLRLRHFELLALLGTEGTVRATARKMALTQPAVSKMLREVEHCFGGELFLRSRAGVTANPKGMELIRHAVGFINELRAVGEQVDAIAAGASATLRVGTFSTLPRVPIAIAAMRKSHPGIVMQIREGSGVELLRALCESELDCIVGTLPPEILQTADTDAIQIRAIAEDYLCVMASPTHALSRSKCIGWADVVDLPWVLPPSESLLRRGVIDASLHAGLAPPSPVVEMTSPVLVTALVRLDSTLLTAMRLERAMVEQSAGRLKILPVKPEIVLPPLSFITRRARADSSKLLEAFRLALTAAVVPPK